MYRKRLVENSGISIDDVRKLDKLLFLDLTVEKNSLTLLETSTLLLNFYLLSSEQLDHPSFRFAKSRVLKNTKYFLVEMRESFFLAKKYPVGLKV